MLKNTTGSAQRMITQKTMKRRVPSVMATPPSKIELGGVSFWQAIAFAGIGYMVGEGISVAVNRKRGRRLKLVASGGVFLTYVVSIMTGVTPSTSMFLGLIVGFYVAIKRF